jgi:hypothetical protein
MAKTKLSQVDKAALERALALRRDSGEPGRREQIDELLQGEGWFSTADFCATGCQRKNLRIKMWEPCPAEIPIDEIAGIIAAGRDGKSGYFAAAKLLKRMLLLGISRFEPDPLTAIDRAKAKQSAAPAPSAA